MRVRVRAEDGCGAILDDVELTERGPNTITDEAAFRAELAGIRETGIAVNDEELALRPALHRRADQRALGRGRGGAQPRRAPLDGPPRPIDERFSPAVLKTAAAISAEIA